MDGKKNKIKIPNPWVDIKQGKNRK